MRGLKTAFWLIFTIFEKIFENALRNALFTAFVGSKICDKMTLLYVLKGETIMNREIKTGGTYHHFKGFIAKVITVAKHTETGETLVVY